MAEIGRRIYYELSTGNVILQIGERQGSVVTTTESEDFQMYAALQPYQQNAIGYIDLAYGQDDANFAAGYPYSVNTTQNPPIIAWATAATDLANAQSQKIAQLRTMYQQTLVSGFNVTIGTTTYTFGWATDDKANMDALQNAIDKTFATFPITYADVHGNPVSVPDQTTLNTIEQTATKFAFAQHQQILNLVGQVQSATSTSAVNAIQWAAATY